MDDLISRQAAIDVIGLDEEIRCGMCKNPMSTDQGCDGNCKYDEILYEKIIQILNKRITPLPSAQPDYTAIKYEIQRNIDDFYNSKHHAQHVSNNGRMIAFGLELALDIVKDVERREDDK